MKHFARSWLLMALALLGAALIGVSAHWLSEMTPLGPSISDYGLVAHALGGKLLTLSIAVLFFGILDRVFLPFLKIEDVFFGHEPWETTGDDTIRAAVILGWFLVFAAIILGFAWGGAS